MSEVRKTSSIARKINFSWFFHTFSLLLFLDILLLALVSAGFIYHFEHQTLGSNWSPDLQRNVVWDAQTLPESIVYTVTGPDGTSYDYLPGDAILSGAPFFFILLGVEGFVLFTNLFSGRRRARRLLRPLTRMARETRELSRAAEALEQYHSLESAIGKISPDKPDEKLSTGSNELHGLEEAINDLLQRMHESYRRQAQFVSDASHELRTPIAVIQGYATMLDRWGKQDEKVLAESITAIKGESEYMNRLVEQLLFLARGDIGRNPVNMQELSLTDLLGEVRDESAMIDQTHEWVFLADADMRLSADAAMLKQCVRILCENARRYTPAGGRIALRAYAQGNEVCFDVQDTGIGISEADMAHIFDRFYRSDPARGRESGGTGLGLAIAKWIVDRHSGHFRVLSRQGLGTRFTVCLPRTQPESAPTEGADAPAQ